MNLEVEIKANQRKVFVAMTILTAVIGILGSIISEALGWGLTGTSGFLIAAGIINFIAFFFSDRLILRSSGATKISEKDVPELFEIVQHLCTDSKLPMPTLYVIEEETMNAFATGRNPSRSAVAVTRGLLERLSRDEVEGVIAHELSHIRNYDMRLMAIVTILAGAIGILADIYWTSSISGKIQERDRSGISAWIGIVLSIFAPLIAYFIQLAISRKREFIADASAAYMTKKPLALASALRKISLDLRLPSHLSVASAHLYFSSPAHGETWIDTMFSTHPPIEERILALTSNLT